MKILRSKEELLAYRASLNATPHATASCSDSETSPSSTIGFVPTMGALHEGHLSLMRESLKNNAHTIVSIFVNPTQFGANEDFDKYPRVLEKDLALCESIGVSAVFTPSVADMYGSDEISLLPPAKMGYVLEGYSRPTHFAGVLCVVLKLFMLAKPHNAYFGQKDAQQVLILKRLIKDYFLDINLIPCPIVRDSDGLALSSRNIYLSPQERQVALCIPRTIETIKSAIQGGERDVARLKAMALASLELSESSADSEASEVPTELFYASFVNHNLEEITHITQGSSLFLIALRVGKTRLLDNLWI